MLQYRADARRFSGNAIGSIEDTSFGFGLFRQMSSLISLEIEGNLVSYVRGDVRPDGRIELSEMGMINLPNNPSDENITSAENTGEQAHPEQDEDFPANELPENELPDRPTPWSEGTTNFLSVISHHAVSQHNINLPFKDKKKIEQVAPLQIQDIVPFEIDDCILDTLILNQQDEVYDIFVALAPGAEIKAIIDSLQSLQINPKTISTKASALTAFITYLPEQPGDNFHLISFTETSLIDCLYVQGNLRFMREVDFPQGEFDLRFSATQIMIANAKLLRDNNIAINNILVLGHSHYSTELSKLTGNRVESLDLRNFCDLDSTLLAKMEKKAWALGLMLHEQRKNKTSSLINFRRGPFAYRQFFTDLLNAAKEELDFYILGACAVLLWAFVTVYTTASALADINDAIKQRMQSLFPGETVVTEKEIDFINRKLSTLNEELKELGPPTTITTLDSIKLLSTISPPEIDTRIETLSIGNAGILFQGSLSDLTKVGKLGTILNENKARFCEIKEDTCKIKVEPKGQIPGSNRTKFSAEIITMDLKDKELPGDRDDLE